MTTLQLPTIHLNGTSRDGLVDPLVEAYGKLGDAYDSLKQTAPNGRDYYPQGPAAFEAARQQHESRLRRVDELRSELEELINAIQYA